MAKLWSRYARRAPRRRAELPRAGRYRPRVAEALEARQLLTSVSQVPASSLNLPAYTPILLELTGATTRDSRSIEVDYRVNEWPGGLVPLVGAPAPRFEVYRSVDVVLDASDLRVATIGLDESTTGDAVQNRFATGDHRVTLPIEGGLPPTPGRPFVIVAASSPSGTTTAAFRKYSIGVVAHGGMILKKWTNGPPWQHQIQQLMEREGYDEVIRYAWVGDSDDPGAAIRQAPRLARRVQAAVDALPDDAIVDLHLIGHSQGGVVVSQAERLIHKAANTAIEKGYTRLTLLDPHAANNGFPGPDLSTGEGIFSLGWLAHSLIGGYKADADDPPLTVPPGVDSVEVFYQRTDAKDDHGVNGGLYNLWGQVPLLRAEPNEVTYYNLTPAGATHSGRYGVQFWYLQNVVPTLADGAPQLEGLRLSGSLASPIAATRARRTIETPTPITFAQKPMFMGQAQPGSKVWLFAGPANEPSTVSLLARTTANADGEWSAQPNRRISTGRWRIVAMAFRPDHSGATRPGQRVLAVAPLGMIEVRHDSIALRGV